MAIKRAKTLTSEQFEDMMARLPDVSTEPVTDRAVLLLSFDAGLRAQEIAGLRWRENLFDATGDWNTTPEDDTRGRKRRVTRMLNIWLGGDIVKNGDYGQERTILATPALFEALKALREQGHKTPFVIPSRKRGASTDLRKRSHALVVRLGRLYEDLGFEDLTSHSGRRTLITNLARGAGQGYSLRDVQAIAGHAKIETTEHYIDRLPTQAGIMLGLRR